MAEETAENPTMHQAFDKAVADDEAATTETDTAVDDETPGDTTSQETEPQSEETEKAADQATETAEENELLSKEDRDNLSPQGKEEYRKLMKSYTPKTQAIAAERKEIAQKQELLTKYGPLIDSFEKDGPAETLKQLNAQYKTEPEAAQDTSPEKTAVENQTSKMETDLKTLLGEGNEEFAGQLAQIFKGNMEELASAIADKKLEPIVADNKARQDQANKEAVLADFKVFEKAHPDWKDHEAKITEFGKKFQRSPDTPIAEYMENLYFLATQNQSAAQTTTKVVNDLKEMVNNSDDPGQGVKDQIVTPAAPKLPTMQEAAAAAAKGIKWES